MPLLAQNRYAAITGNLATGWWENIEHLLDPLWLDTLDYIWAKDPRICLRG